MSGTNPVVVVDVSQKDVYAMHGNELMMDFTRKHRGDLDEHGMTFVLIHDMFSDVIDEWVLAVDGDGSVRMVVRGFCFPAIKEVVWDM